MKKMTAILALTLMTTSFAGTQAIAGETQTISNQTFTKFPKSYSQITVNDEMLIMSKKEVATFITKIMKEEGPLKDLMKKINDRDGGDFMEPSKDAVVAIAGGKSGAMGASTTFIIHLINAFQGSGLIYGSPIQVEVESSFNASYDTDDVTNITEVREIREVKTDY